MGTVFISTVVDLLQVTIMKKSDEIRVKLSVLLI